MGQSLSFILERVISNGEGNRPFLDPRSIDTQNLKCSTILGRQKKGSVLNRDQHKYDCNATI